MKKITIIITSLLITTFLSAQQIGDGRALEITDFSVPLKSGVYQGSLPLGMNPDTQVYGWQHLFVIRHSNDLNNHQLQLSSSYTTNDRLFFRKLAGSLEPNNPAWIELATRGANKFIGDQSISGNVGVGTTTPSYKLDVNVTSNSDRFQVQQGSNVRFFANGDGVVGWGISADFGYLSWDSDFAIIGGQSGKALSLRANGADQIRITTVGNVGIGTINPDSKLTVKGKIHAEEVKIDLSIPAPDYVFANDYKLKTLQEVEEYIKQNKHLPEIPSAQEIEKNGLMLAEMNMSLLKKIEELTIYAIEEEKKNNLQSKEIETLKKENESFKAITERLIKIENQLKKQN